MRKIGKWVVGAVIIAAVAGCLNGTDAPRLVGPPTIKIEEASGKTAAGLEAIKFEQFKLPNGLQVILAPMENTPAVHVRVLYHVGSRDEREDRQGFAHMFEHMMFRGSEHVKPQEHMRTISGVGGYSNAFTSFDQTVYHQSVPAAYLETVLYLEADRMASFKVSPEIFGTERNVVAEEWRLRQNQPYGTMWEELLKEMFTKHSYRWTPIGNMDHLRSAETADLQAFFNKYYVPNNAVLVVAGKIDSAEAKKLVEKYYGWIPSPAVRFGAGPVDSSAGSPVAVKRDIAAEPVQTSPRRKEIELKVPLARVVIAYPMPPLNSPDADALGMLSAILGDGRSSRLPKLLVSSKKPLCTSASSLAMALEDGGAIGAMATLLADSKIEDVEKELRGAIAEIRDKGVTQEELAKAKLAARIHLAGRRETAESVASELGNEALFYGDPSRVNTEESRLNALTVEDIQRVAKKYFVDQKCTTLIIKPVAEAKGAIEPLKAANELKPVDAPAVKFPAGYPAKAPLPTSVMKATFAKGTEKTIGGVKVIAMPDRITPLVGFTLTMRHGSYGEPPGKEGLGSMTSAMIRRGPAGTTYNAFNDDLESRGISIEVGDGGDTTRISGSCLAEELPYAIAQARRLLMSPALDAEEFAKLQNQTINGLKVGLNSPTGVAAEELDRLTYGNSSLGRTTMPASIASITLDDVKSYYFNTYRPDNAVLMFVGNVTVADAQAHAQTLLSGWETWKPANYLTPDFNFPPRANARTILLIDRPESKQANVRMASRAFSIASDEKFAGTLATQILSSGIDSRLGRYVRAERGLSYGVSAGFAPTRQDGTFFGSTDTKVESTADSVEAMFVVLNKMKAENVTDAELAEAKLRVAGSMLMQTQTTSQQAGRRVDAILNNYPIDYFDNYAERISKVTADEIRGVMNKHFDDSKLAIVIVAPAATVQEQLKRLGEVKVLPMPLAREKP